MKLAELFIQFSTKGGDKAKKDVDFLAGAVSAFAGPMGMLAKVATGAAAALMGVVAAGFAGTIQGERFGASMKYFSETVASLFLPIITRATEMFYRFSNMLENSTGTVQFQQAMEKVADAMEKVFEDLAPLAIEVFAEFADVLLDVIVPALNAVVETVKWLVEQFKALANFVSRWTGGSGDIQPEALERDRANRTGGQRPDRVTKGHAATEGPADAYRRIQLAILNADAATNYPRRSAEAAERQEKEQQRTNEILRGLEPAVGR